MLSTSGLLLPFTVTRRVTIQEISIAPDARDTKVGVGRELTNGNPSSVQLFENGSRADCTYFKQDNRRTSRDQKLGQTF